MSVIGPGPARICRLPAQLSRKSGRAQPAAAADENRPSQCHDDPSQLAGQSNRPESEHWAAFEVITVTSPPGPESHSISLESESSLSLASESNIDVRVTGTVIGPSEPTQARRRVSNLNFDSDINLKGLKRDSISEVSICRLLADSRYNLSKSLRGRPLRPVLP
jgi:hypothetical protein